MKRVKVWTPSREFEGETILVVGGGSSIRDLGHDKLLPKFEGKCPVIACNAAFLLAPFAEVLFGADVRFWNEFSPFLHRHLGWWKVARRPPAGRLRYPLWTVKFEHKGGLSLDPSVVHGRNSGHIGMNLACHLGAARIILVGFDMVEKAPKQHFHTLHSRPANTDGFQLWRDDFALATPILKKQGVTVLNANPNSGLQVFPFCNLEDWL